MPLEKSALFSFLAAAGSVRESWRGKTPARESERRCAWRSAAVLCAALSCAVKPSGMQRVGAERMLCLAGSTLQRAGANMPGTVLVFTSEFGFLLA